MAAKGSNGKRERGHPGDRPRLRRAARGGRLGQRGEARRALQTGGAPPPHRPPHRHLAAGRGRDLPHPRRPGADRTGVDPPRLDRGDDPDRRRPAVHGTAFAGDRREDRPGGARSREHPLRRPGDAAHPAPARRGHDRRHLPHLLHGTGQGAAGAARPARPAPRPAEAPAQIHRPHDHLGGGAGSGAGGGPRRRPRLRPRGALGAHLRRRGAGQRRPRRPRRR